MTLDPRLVAWIDHARRQGRSFHDIAAHLKRAGVRDVQACINAYGATLDHLKRPRAQANPGDPSDPLHRP